MSTKGTDIAAIIGKGLVGAIPFVGPLVAEIVGTIIPNQRIDRIEALLKYLEEKLSAADQNEIKKRITSPESVDLIEDGFVQTSRALSDERKEYIASLLKNSLTDESLRHIEYKTLLSLLGELNDLEVLILKSHSIVVGGGEYREFWDKHGDALTPPRAFLGSSQDDLDKHTLHETQKAHLARLGLLKPQFKKPKKGEIPEFDEKAGMIKAQGYNITSLGRLLLRSIDQGGEI